MNLSAVIVTYNNADTIDTCIESLKKQGIQEIVIVDNASSDATVSRASNYSVTVISRSQNSGFASGVNEGVRQVTNPYAFVLNPDAFVHEGSLSSVIRFMEEHPSVGIVGLQLVDSKGRPEAHSYGKSVTPLSLLARHLHSSTYPRSPVAVGWVSGGAMVVSVNELNAIGWFDEAFFLYWEDVDVCRRMWRVGKKVMLFPSVVVQHVRGASSHDQTAKTALYDESADRYFRKHYSQPIWKLQRLLRRLYRLLRPQAL